MFVYLNLIFFIIFILLFLIVLWVYWLDLLGFGGFREAISAYECGFDSKDLSRLPFSLRFFLIIIFFIILDVEVCLLLQLPYEMDNFYYGNRIWFWLFLVILLVGVLEELRLGLLSWK
uniref:NADH dehydrogenase subunit 3 n=1 Tax=Arthurdendyus triangulatus TaxID=132421 RepID=UPI002E778215|nr:NADH dehydrogenase subunit 3 [Arthurdendyus triangulatus]WPY71419.1 NADH dehydrogenase subunit 3 [Arthurdendyus triangulatus]